MSLSTQFYDILFIFVRLIRADSLFNYEQQPESAWSDDEPLGSPPMAASPLGKAAPPPSRPVVEEDEADSPLGAPPAMVVAASAAVETQRPTSIQQAPKFVFNHLTVSFS
jgi:hypothetical protein